MRESLAAYLDDLGRHPVLSAEEERSLARAYRERGDTAAAHRLVTSNLRFVVKVAAGYRGYGLKLADLIQEGNLGLMRAVEKFDPDQGIRLISYAVWWIRAYIQGYVLQSWSLVKVGTTQAQRRLFFSLARTRRELGEDLEGDELDERVARRLRVRTDDVRQATRRMEGRDVSIDAPGASGATPLERLESDDVPPDELLSQAREAQSLRSGVAKALSLLDDRERVIVEERLMADDPASLQDLGARFGFSRERARQIEIRARGKLRLALGALAAGVEGVGPPPRTPEPELLAAG
ncbi:MAG TPA: RNA polymerase factor sigma-32 [Anaeromyxobacteraceae bacterium]|nr:RNA polymerase factor sigma-32 [Anaeromyxobacteraceae bacterium]